MADQVIFEGSKLGEFASEVILEFVFILHWEEDYVHEVANLLTELYQLRHTRLFVVLSEVDNCCFFLVNHFVFKIFVGVDYLDFATLSRLLTGLLFAVQI